jgi:4,5-DOPA dioxygenase extradiol
MSLRNPDQTDAWAKEFDDWMLDRIRKWDTEAVFDYLTLAPHAKLATPDYEHFLPLLIAMGTGHQEKQMKVLHQSYQYGSLSHLIVEFA